MSLPSEGVRREQPDLPAGNAPAPLWLIPFTGAVLFLGAAYLFLFSGGFRGDVFNEEAGLRGPDEAETAAADAHFARDPAAFLAQGRRLYLRNCAVCHQPDGGGLGGQYPPLAGSEIVLGTGPDFGPNHLARILLNGLVQPVTVRGALYNGAMVPWGEVLTDAQLAAVLTYVRQAWGNQAGPIAPAGVAAVRAEVAGKRGPWTITQLRQIPPAPLPVNPDSPPDPNRVKVSR